VHHHVEIHVEAGGMGVGDKSAEQIDGTVAGWHAALLFLAAEVAPIEHAVAVAAVACAALRLADRRQLQRGEAGGAQLSDLSGQKIQ
jgi:hypothetical protein